MAEVPTDTGITAPVVLPIVATAGVALLHVPPEVELVSVEPLPIHEDNDPDIAAGSALTVNTAPVAHPFDKVYDIIEVPAETAATTPEELPIVATEAVALVQVPPEVVLVSVEPLPTHAANEPDMEAGKPFTVNTAPAAQPVGKVYDIVEVPADTAATIPEALPIVATAVVALLQAPPAEVLPKVDAPPAQADNVPEIAAGKALTV